MAAAVRLRIAAALPSPPATVSFHTAATDHYPLSPVVTTPRTK